MKNQSIEIMGFYKLKPKKACKVTLEDIEQERLETYNRYINHVFVSTFRGNKRETLSIDPQGAVWPYGFSHWDWMERVTNTKLIEEATRLVLRKDTLTEFKNALCVEFKNN